MHRIEDNYNWRRLEQWKTVLDKGNVKWRCVEQEEVEDTVLEEAVILLKKNCFPVAIVCCCKEDRSREILGTPLWNGIFSFLEDRRCINIGGRAIFFKDMDTTEKKQILSAHIFAIWVRD